VLKVRGFKKNIFTDAKKSFHGTVSTRNVNADTSLSYGGDGRAVTEGGRGRRIRPGSCNNLSSPTVINGSVNPSQLPNNNDNSFHHSTIDFNTVTELTAPNLSVYLPGNQLKSELGGVPPDFSLHDNSLLHNTSYSSVVNEESEFSKSLMNLRSVGMQRKSTPVLSHNSNSSEMGLGKHSVGQPDDSSIDHDETSRITLRRSSRSSVQKGSTSTRSSSLGYTPPKGTSSAMRNFISDSPESNLPDRTNDRLRNITAKKHDRIECESPRIEVVSLSSLKKGSQREYLKSSRNRGSSTNMHRQQPSSSSQSSVITGTVPSKSRPVQISNNRKTLSRVKSPVSDNKESVFKNSSHTTLEAPFEENQQASQLDAYDGSTSNKTSCVASSSSSSRNSRRSSRNERASGSNNSEDSVAGKKKKRSRVVIQDHISVIPCTLNITK